MRCLLLVAALWGQTVELDPRLEAVGAHDVAAGGKAPAGPYGALVKKRFARAKAAKPGRPIIDRLDVADRLAQGRLVSDPLQGEWLKPWLADLERFKAEESFDEFWKEAEPLLRKRFEEDKARILALDAAGKVKRYARVEFKGKYVVTLTPFIQSERMLNSVWPGEVRTMLSLPDGERPHADYFWKERLPAALWHQLLHGALDETVEKHIGDWFQEKCFGSRVQCAREHVIRSILVRMLEREAGPEAAERQRKDGDEAMFPHLAYFEERLKGYEAQKRSDLKEVLPGILRNGP